MQHTCHHHKAPARFARDARTERRACHRTLDASPTPTPSPTPEPTPTPTPTPETYTLSVIGDCTLWSNANYAQHPAGYAGVINGDYSYPFSNTIQYFENDDFTIANFECILSDKNLAYDYTQVYFPFIAPTEYSQHHNRRRR